MGVGPHSHSVWEETDEEVGEPAPHRPAVSTGYPLTSDEALLSLLLSFSFTVLHNQSEQFICSVRLSGSQSHGDISVFSEK